MNPLVPSYQFAIARQQANLGWQRIRGDPSAKVIRGSGKSGDKILNLAGSKTFGDRQTQGMMPQELPDFPTCVVQSWIQP